MKKMDLKRLAALDGSLNRDRLDHLLAFIEARRTLRVPVNVLLEMFYSSKEYVKARMNWGRRVALGRPAGDRSLRVRPSEAAYAQWVEDTEPGPGARDLLKQLAGRLPNKPLISVLMPTHNAPMQYLREAVESVRRQIYPNWELCIADDASTNPAVKELLQRYVDEDARIKVVFRRTNGHISLCSNSALELVTGDYTALLDHDDMLSDDALFHVALTIGQQPAVDMIYSDEDKLSEDNERYAPFFKPDWAPESFLSRMYTCHLGVYRTSLLRRIGGFRQGFEGSQDYDMVLRFTEQTDKIVHVPRVLYHWRVHQTSTAMTSAAKPYAFVAAKEALSDALARRKQPGRVLDVPDFTGHYRVRYDLPERASVGIVIPTRDLPNTLEKCLDSLFAVTTYRDFHVVIVDNGSVRPQTARLLERWSRAEPNRFTVVRDDSAFNFSALCNLGAKHTDARFLVFLNNDTEIIEPDWLEGLIEYAQMADIGAVGPKLLYGNGAVQHVGVVLGLGGPAGHVHLGLPGRAGGYYGYAVCSNNVAAVTGACLAVERAKFDAVGGFDETLAIAYNDVDLCLKLLKAGYRNVLLPNIEVVHHESMTRGADVKPEKWSRLLGEGLALQRKWAGTFWRDPYYSPNLTLRDGSCAVASRAERSPRPDVWTAGVYEQRNVDFRAVEPVRIAPMPRATAPKEGEPGVVSRGGLQVV